MSKQATVDNILQTCVKKIELEVGAMLGQTLSCTRHVGSFISKAEYLARMEEQAVLTRMAVSGDLQDEAYTVVDLKTAIIFGGTLIMLPDDELKSRAKDKVFDEEVADAFGEIANIMAGVYTAVFLERLTQKIHCKKTEVASFAPWEATDTSPFAERGYYLSTTSIKLDDRDMGKIEALFPVEVLELSQNTAAPAAGPSAQTGSSPQATTVTQQAAASPGAASQTLVNETSQSAAGGGTTFSAVSPGANAAQATATIHSAHPGSEYSARSVDLAAGSLAAAEESCPLLLITAETQEDANAFGVPLASRHYEVLCLTFQDNLREAVRGRQLKGVVLVMRAVGERELASLIKIRSAIDQQTPLLVAGPQWTRRTVLQAVKYGARDILVTPASPEEILAKACPHLLQ